MSIFLLLMKTSVASGTTVSNTVPTAIYKKIFVDSSILK